VPWGCAAPRSAHTAVPEDHDSNDKYPWVVRSAADAFRLWRLHRTVSRDGYHGRVRVAEIVALQSMEEVHMS
jgi:hypothetical protein